MYVSMYNFIQTVLPTNYCKVNELMVEIDLLNGTKNALSQEKSNLLTQIASITDINKQTNVRSRRTTIVFCVFCFLHYHA